MSKVLTFLRVALLLTVVALVGCGGGGGSSSGGGTLTDTNRYITGKIVNGSNTGVANVTVALGGTTATSDSSGNFRIGPVAGTINHVFSVDATGAGDGYSQTELVTFNSQQYEWNAIDTPVGIRNEATNSLGTITVSYNPDGVPSIPFPDKDTVIAGRIVRSDSPTTGIAGVVVTFGTATVVTATTGKNGYFALNIGRNVSVTELFYDTLVFSIDTSNVTPAIPNTMEVKYNGYITAQTAIAVPDDVSGANGTAAGTDLGNITVDTGNGFESSGGGGDTPPDFPTDPY